MTKAIVENACVYCSMLFLALLLQSNLAAAEPYKSWVQLTPMQQEALKPLSAQWDSLPAKLQKNLLHTTDNYPKLTPDKKHRFQSRLEKWSKLTPEQREYARNKYRAINKAHREKREQAKRMANTQTANTATAASGIPVGAPAH